MSTLVDALGGHSSPSASKMTNEPSSFPHTRDTNAIRCDMQMCQPVEMIWVRERGGGRGGRGEKEREGRGKREGDMERERREGEGEKM